MCIVHRDIPWRESPIFLNQHSRRTTSFHGSCRFFSFLSGEERKVGRNVMRHHPSPRKIRISLSADPESDGLRSSFSPMFGVPFEHAKVGDQKRDANHSFEAHIYIYYTHTYAYL